MAQTQPQRGNGTGPIVTEDARKEKETRSYARLGALATLIGLLLLVGGLVYGRGMSDAGKASTQSVDTLRDWTDGRLDALEKERATTVERLKSIDEKLGKIENKLDRLIPWPP